MLLLIGLSRALRLTKISDYLADKLLWNYFLRFVIQQYVTLYIASLINLYRVVYSTNGDYTGDVLSFVILPGCLVILPVMAAIVVKTGGTLPQFKSLTEGLRDNSTVAKLWTVITLGKWCLTLTILVVLRDCPAI